MNFIACESRDVFRHFQIFFYIRNNLKLSSVVRSLKNKQKEVPTAQVMELGISCPFLYCLLRTRLRGGAVDLGLS